MTENDLTIKILQGIRDDLQRSNQDNAQRFEVMNQRFDAVNQRFDAVNQRFDAVNQRFEVVETVLRDISEQMVMQSRGIKAAIEARASFEKRVDDHEKRITELENRGPH
jgi:chromosome segregation ATPase